MARECRPDNYLQRIKFAGSNFTRYLEEVKKCEAFPRQSTACGLIALGFVCGIGLNDTEVSIFTKMAEDLWREDANLDTGKSVGENPSLWAMREAAVVSRLHEIKTPEDSLQLRMASAQNFLDCLTGWIPMKKWQKERFLALIMVQQVADDLGTRHHDNKKNFRTPFVLIQNPIESLAFATQSINDMVKLMNLGRAGRPWKNSEVPDAVREFVASYSLILGTIFLASGLALVAKD